MTLPIQDPGESQGLSDAFGVKGKLSLALDGIVVPTVVVNDLTSSPFTAVRNVSAYRRQGAQVGRFSCVMASAGTGLILQIERITISNEGAAAAVFELRMQNPTEVALGTVAATARFKNMMVPLVTEVAGVRPRLSPSSVHAFHAAAIAGGLENRYNIGAASHIEVEVGRGWYLYGDDPLGPGYLSVWHDTANNPLSCAFWGREFKNKG